MRIGQVIRYFAPAGRAGQDKEEEAARDTAENTCSQDRFRPQDAEDAAGVTDSNRRPLLFFFLLLVLFKGFRKYLIIHISEFRIKP